MYTNLINIRNTKVSNYRKNHRFSNVDLKNNDNSARNAATNNDNSSKNIVKKFLNYFDADIQVPKEIKKRVYHIVFNENSTEINDKKVYQALKYVQMKSQIKCGIYIFNVSALMYFNSFHNNSEIGSILIPIIYIINCAYGSYHHVVISYVDEKMNKILDKHAKKCNNIENID